MISDDLCAHGNFGTCSACLMHLHSTSRHTLCFSNYFYLIAVLLINFSLPMWQITSLGQAIYHNRHTIRAVCLEGGDSKVLWFEWSFMLLRDWLKNILYWWKMVAWPLYICIKCTNVFLLILLLEWKVQHTQFVLLKMIFFYLLNEQPGTDPQQDDRWGCFKWSVHVHVIDLEDSTTSHWGDEEGLPRSGEEGPVQQHCKNKWAPTQLSGLSHYWASPTYWFIPLHLNKTLARHCGTLTHVEWVILEP